MKRIFIFLFVFFSSMCVNAHRSGIYTAYVYGALVLFIRSENDSSVQYIVLSSALS